MVDLELYVALVDWFDELERAEQWQGAGEAAFQWFKDRVASDDLDYVLMGTLCLVGHFKGHGWQTEARQPELDRQIWTWHRVWTDRYGWEPTMAAGKERQERWSREANPGR